MVFNKMQLCLVARIEESDLFLILSSQLKNTMLSFRFSRTDHCLQFFLQISAKVCLKKKSVSKWNYPDTCQLCFCLGYLSAQQIASYVPVSAKSPAAKCQSHQCKAWNCQKPPFSKRGNAVATLVHSCQVACCQAAASPAKLPVAKLQSAQCLLQKNLMRGPLMTHRLSKS